MYNSNILCTYDKIDYNYQEDLYRVQLLQILNCETFDEDVVNNKLDILYNSLKNELFIKQILEKIKNSKDLELFIHLLGLNTDDVLFRFLFKFEYFIYFHRCLSEYYNNNNVSKKTLDNLFNII